MVCNVKPNGGRTGTKRPRETWARRPRRLVPWNKLSVSRGRGQPARPATGSRAPLTQRDLCTGVAACLHHNQIKFQINLLFKTPSLVCQGCEVERVRADELLVAPEMVAAAGVANKGQTARVPVRGALAHELRVGRHSGQRVEAEVARVLVH